MFCDQTSMPNNLLIFFIIKKSVLYEAVIDWASLLSC
jgi:hypothetical protein